MNGNQSWVGRANSFFRFRGSGPATAATLVVVVLLVSVLAGSSAPLWAQNGGFAYTANGACSCEQPPQPPVQGTISAYTIDPASGILTEIAGSPFSAGVNSHSLAVDPTGQFLYVANHESNDVSAYTIDGTSGVLTPISGSPFAAGSGPHSVTVDPSGQFVYVANDLSSNVSAYAIDRTSGTLTEISGSPFAAGAGPHAVVVDPSGQFVYVANHDSNNISAYTIRWGGGLTSINGSPFLAGTGPHGVTVDPTDRFVYVANHLSNNVSAYAISWWRGARGALMPISGSPFAAGTAPHGVTVDPSARFIYVANHDSNNVSAYTITLWGRARGALTPISGSPFAAGTGPHGATIDATGQFLYVANHLSNDISAYTITLWGGARGALTPISGSPFAGLSPLAVTTTRQNDQSH